MNASSGAGVTGAYLGTPLAMVVTAVQNVINVAGSCVLLFGLWGAPKMGVTGVALASVFSRVVASIAFGVFATFSLAVGQLIITAALAAPAAAQHAGDTARITPVVITATRS